MANLKTTSSIPRKSGTDGDTPATITHLKPFSKQKASALNLDAIVSLMTRSQREKIISGYDMKSLASVFEENELMNTVYGYLNNGMNISRTARALYMHRNTLNYRVKAVIKKTGLDIRSFDMAVTFKILHILYLNK